MLAVENMSFGIVPIRCRATSQPERLAIYGVPIPEGMRLGWTCNKPYCSNPEHFCLTENKNASDYNYKPIRERLCALGSGEWFDAEIPQLITERDIIKFRCGLSMINHTPHFIMRLLCRGRVRLIRVGDYYDDANEWRAHYPVPTAKKVSLWKRPAVIWLGILAFSGSTKSASTQDCRVKGCPFPALHGALDCRHHQPSHQFSMSMEDRTLDRYSLYRPSEPYSPYDLAAEIPVSTANLENSLRVITGVQKAGATWTESKAHRNMAFEADAKVLKEETFKRPYKKAAPVRNWSLDTPALWQPWIAAAERKVNFLPADERTDGAIYEAVVESASQTWQLSEDALMEAARRVATSTAIPNSHIRVLREKPIEYTPESTIANYQGRGTRGGHPGGHRKIRKSQRKRPAGWHGSRPDHDVEKRWSRETIEEIERVEDYHEPINVETLNETGWIED